MSDSYKNILKDKNLRLKLLGLLDWVPDSIMLKIQYRIKCEKRLNLKNPKRWTEKCQWYKLYYRDPLMTRCADKYEVRSYVEEKGLEDILNTSYGVYESADEINIDNLPEKFVLKMTSGSGGNIIVKNKAELNWEEAKEKLNGWMALEGRKPLGREWPYYNIQPRIIAEKYMEETENGLIDYKFFCFNGEPSHLIVVSDRFTQEKIDLYDMNWNRMKVVQSDCPRQSIEDMDCPRNFDKMIEIARTLSKDFPHARIDLYNIKGKIYFGEITFFSASGYYIFDPDEFDFWLGEKFKLPEKMLGGGYSEEAIIFVYTSCDLQEMEVAA